MLHLKDISSWERQSEADKMIYLRGFIKMRHIKSVTTDELVEFLVLLANTPFTNDAAAKEEVERYTSLVQHLLQVRLTESLHRRSMIAAVLALVISALALVASWRASHSSGSTPSVQPAPSTAQQAPSK